jgi:hypothetical protein
LVPKPSLRASHKIFTPEETGAQPHDNALNLLDSGACPGPDLGFAGMTKKGIFGLSISLSSSHQGQNDVKAKKADKISIEPILEHWL